MLGLFAKVPLAPHGGVVTRLGKHLGHRQLLARKSVGLSGPKDSQQSGTKSLTYKCTAADPGKSSLDEWTRNADTTGFALPTEAEWAVACYYQSKDDNPGDTAIHQSYGAKRPLNRKEIVKRKIKPNSLGIYCMRGNVSELVSDAAGALLKREVTMGGHFKLTDDDADGSNRQEIYPDDDRSGIGFRLALPATQ